MIKDIIDKAQMESKRVLIYSHQKPDADAICSERALIEYLKRFDVEAVYVVGKQINKNIMPIRNLNTQHTLSVIVDTSTLEYAENTKFLKNKKEDIYVYDHHIKSDGQVIEDQLQLPSKNVVRNSNESSNCEVLLNDFDHKKITPEVANFLLEGIIADSAILLYTKPNTIKNIITLISLGADYQTCYNRVDAHRSTAIEKGLGLAYLNTQKVNLGDCFGTYLLLDNEKIKTLHQKYTLKDLQKTIIRMQHIKGCAFNLVIAENEKGEFDVAMRSNSDFKNFDVQQIAQKFGGGGHHNAAGCHFSASEGYDIQKVQNLIFEEINKLAKENSSQTKIEFNEKDDELAKIFMDTNKLSTNTDKSTFVRVQQLIDEGAHYSILRANYKTFEQFMLENELATLLPDEVNTSTDTLEINISPEKNKYLKNKYKFDENTVNNYANSLKLKRIKNLKFNLLKNNLEK